MFKSKYTDIHRLHCICGGYAHEYKYTWEGICSLVYISVVKYIYNWITHVYINLWILFQETIESKLTGLRFGFNCAWNLK